MEPQEPIHDDDDFETRLIKFGKYTPPGTSKASESSGEPVDVPEPAPSGANPAYLRGAIELAASELAAMPKDSGRNDQLNDSAFDLARFRELERGDVYLALMDACRRNGLLAEDGQHQCDATFESGWSAGRRAEPRQVPLPRPRVVDNVVWLDPPPLSPDNSGKPDSLGTPPDSSGPPPNGTHDFDPRPFEDDFWARESLAQIYWAALGRMCSPWAILVYCVARVLALVLPGITLPPVIGSKGSLNFFGLIISKSGGGKSIANELATELIPGVPVVRNLGSGEGIVGQFRRPKRGSEEPIHNTSVMFIGDEGDSFNALNSRSASTTMSILKTAFSGGVLGFSYITRGRDVHVPAHEYRMTVVINMQPATAGPLMDDVIGGTPQRFGFFPGNDPRFNVDIPEVPFPGLEIPSPGTWQHARMLNVPEEAKIEMREDRVRRASGEGDPLDGHLLFWRAKFAFALALIDNRTDMTSEDWRLAGIATNVSCACRGWLLKQLDAAERIAAQKRGTLQGVAQAELAHEKEFQTRQKLNRVAQWAQEKLHEAGAAGLTKRELTQKCASRDRGMLDEALKGLVDMDRVSFDAAQKRWTIHVG